jgi:DNA polymerase-3 subunit gamma/tau
MSYQVLARKWRPKRFTEMVGQEHVLKALVNALDEERLHHAYLFTGTRGVGKTSIARLFAKSLNCEQGISSEPCGQCSACREIAEGRFVDLIEVDAASRTKVEDTRELLENVQYAPTHGRFKVYLIDEVHMLSTHSFNALLKTLEEPPPHVKFLLATTDPQKLPVTILSRCLQFNLKNLIPERIVQHLQFVLGEESIQFEEPALWLLARSADGSMRDALSLTDQAIAFGAGSVIENDVRAMLGTIDQRLVYRMLDALTAHDPSQLLDAVAQLAQFSPDYMTVLGDLISVLHRVAIAQALPAAVDNSLGDQEHILSLSSQLSAEDVQLFYQIALMGRKDLPFVPDAREGLEMVLLRMLAFRPADQAAKPIQLAGNASTNSASTSPAPTTAPSAPASPSPQSAHVATAAQAPSMPEPVTEAAVSEPVQNTVQETVQETAPTRASIQSVSLRPEPSAAPASTTPAMPEEPMRSAPEPKPAQPPQMQDVPPWEEDIPPPTYDDMPPMMDTEEPAYSPAKKSEPAALSPLTSATVAPVETALPKEEVELPAVEVTPEMQVAWGDFQLSDWVHVVGHLGLTGMTASLAGSLSLEVKTDTAIEFHYTQEQEAMLSGVHKERIQEALVDYFKAQFEVKFLKEAQTQETPRAYFARKRAERLAEAVASFEQDSTVQSLVAQFEATILKETIIPID